MHELFRAGLIIAGLAVMGYATDWIGQHHLSGTVPDGLAITLAGSTIFAVFLGIDRVVKRPWGHRRLRHLLFRHARYEGLWAERVSVRERPYALGLIRFVGGEPGWKYEGISYDQNFQPAAQWESFRSYHNPRERHWQFPGWAWLLAWSTDMDAYRPSNRFLTQTTLMLPDMYGSEMDAAAIFLDADDKGPPGFWLTLKRADGALQKIGRNPEPLSADVLKRMEPERVKQIFVDLKILRDVAGIASHSSGDAAVSGRSS